MDKYREAGLKITPQRLAILQFLEGNRNHPSAEDIYCEIRKKYPMTSFATVYKTIELLKNRGDLHELTIDAARKRYDPDTRSHHHLICLGCKKIIDIYTEYKLDVPENVQGSFEMVGNHIEFYGICPDCKKKRGEQSNGKV